ncbi:MAG: phosphoribosylglycinamide formyltransferase [Candidatus Omnitrophota bacterium]|nr:MAG: phosphoribosylglycinamide formyltransferase [Candidatus Omnitrophota bacterium]
MNLAVLASGKGTNFASIAAAVKKGYIKANLKVLLVDKKDAPARGRAKKFGVKDIFINPGDYKSRLTYDKALVKILKKEKVDLVILAGFMRVLTPYFVKSFKDKIINIHPAMLPAFRGVDAIERAFKYGSKFTGVTIHFVDDKVDHGPVIMQEPIKITQALTLKELEAKVHKLEHKLYPLVVKLFVEKKIKKQGRNVKIG